MCVMVSHLPPVLQRKGRMCFLAELWSLCLLSIPFHSLFQELLWAPTISSHWRIQTSFYRAEKMPSSDWSTSVECGDGEGRMSLTRCSHGYRCFHNTGGLITSLEVNIQDQVLLSWDSVFHSSLSWAQFGRIFTLSNQCHLEVRFLAHWYTVTYF